MPTLLTIALWLVSVAYAGAGVQLPPGEDSAAWAPAFEFAGLETPAPGTEPQIRIEVRADKWILRASDSRGTVRTAEVDVPNTDRDREEVALVAGGLIRAMAAADAPPQDLGTLPPPPPPPPPVPKTRTVAPAPAATAPPPARADEDGPILMPRPAAPPSESMNAPVADRPLQGGGAGSSRRSDRPNRVVMAPLALGAGGALRPQTRGGLMATVGTQITRKNNWSLDANVSLQANTPLDLNGARALFTALEIEALGLYRINRFLSVGPLAGVSFKTFQQDAVFVGDVTLPKVGGVGHLTVLGGRWWAVRFVAKPAFDIGIVELQPASSQNRNLAVFGVQTGISFAIGNRVDPFLRKRTSRK